MKEVVALKAGAHHTIGIWHYLKFSTYSNDMLLTAFIFVNVANVDADTSNEENSAIIISVTAIASMATKTLEKLVLKCHQQKAIQIFECLEVYRKIHLLIK